jgi:hypothetical protein
MRDASWRDPRSPIASRASQLGRARETRGGGCASSGWWRAIRHSHHRIPVHIVATEATHLSVLQCAAFPLLCSGAVRQRDCAESGSGAERTQRIRTNWKLARRRTTTEYSARLQLNTTGLAYRRYALESMQRQHDEAAMICSHQFGDVFVATGLSSMHSLV